MTPAERRIRGRIGALSLHAQGKTNTSPARARFLSRFETEVDPDGTLPAAERSKRAEHARKLYFTRLALKSAATRRDKEEAVEVEHLRGLFIGRLYPGELPREGRDVLV